MQICPRSAPLHDDAAAVPIVMRTSAVAVVAHDDRRERALARCTNS
jgi:hypothetical protein